MFTQKNRFTLILLSVAVLLLIPFIAMQFTSEVNWTFSDFLAMGFLLLGAGLICELVLRTVKKNRNRVILCLLVLALFFLVWAELAVGFFGTPFAGS